MHEPSEERIRGVGDMATRVIMAFKDLVDDAEEMDVGCLDLVVTYIDVDDEFVPGTYVPELHLVVRKVDDDADCS